MQSGFETSTYEQGKEFKMHAVQETMLNRDLYQYRVVFNFLNSA